jgi:hypothetical protein
MSNFSPMRLGTLLTGVTFTAVIGFAVAAEHSTGINLIPDDLASALWFAATLSWFGHIAAICRDSMMKQLNGRLDTITADIDGYGDQRETTGRLAGRRDVTEAANGRRPHLVP